MSDVHQIEKNFKTLRELFTSLSRVINQLKQQNFNLEKDNKTIMDANRLLQESMNRLLSIKNEDQHTEFESLNQSFDRCSQKKLENYHILLQNKIVDLEKQLLLSQRQETNSLVNNIDEEMSTLKIKYNALLLENKSLKEQLSNFRNLHNQVISEIRLNNLNHTNSNNQQEYNTMNISSMIVDIVDQNELQPLRVDVFDSETEDLCIDLDK